MYAQNTTFVGLDVHKKSIVGAILPPGKEKPEELGKINNEPSAVKRLVKKLKKRSDGPIVACYEAGACGYDLQRMLTSLGIQCIVVAPSLIPSKPGDHIKTDRRDARNLAKYLRAGLLTEVRPPTPEEEAVRDLTRAREDAKKDQLRARHRLSKFLLRHGHVYQGGKQWTARHKLWLNKQQFTYPSEKSVFRDYTLALDQIAARIEEIGQDLMEIAESPKYAEKVGWLRCFRGIDTIIAITILAELHDFRRFSSPRALMSYLGLTPSEYSSDEKKKRGGITKAGNSHVRRMLIQAAWSYRHQPRVSRQLAKRRQGQPGRVIAIADKAQQRLNRRYQRLKARQKHHNIIIVAVARELIGFIWSVLQPAAASDSSNGADPHVSNTQCAKSYRLKRTRGAQ